MKNDEPRGLIVAHTDGACLGNPGPGGWAVRLTYLDHEGNPAGRKITRAGGAERTTNNRMEMTAACDALACTPSGSRVEIVSDSLILVKGMTEWLDGWIARGWRKGDRKPVENQGLWKQLVELSADRTVTWRWVKGHNGDPDNEYVDQMANTAARTVAGGWPVAPCVVPSTA